MEEKEFNEPGFVVNESGSGVFKLQRQLPPGSKLKFSDAFKVLGKQSGQDGKDFVKWLRETTFPGPDWGFYSAEGKPFFSDSKKSSNKDVAPQAPEVVEDQAPGAGKTIRGKDKKGAKKGVEITPTLILETPYEQAEAIIDSCRDKNVLRKALTLSQYLANKGEHTRRLMRRLEQV